MDQTSQPPQSGQSSSPSTPPVVPSVVPQSDQTASQTVSAPPVTVPANLDAQTTSSDSTPSVNQSDKIVSEDKPLSIENDIPVPPNAMSGPMKEFGPPSAPPTELVMPTEAAPDIPQEVKEAGVEESPNTEQPNIPQQVQQTTGIQPAHEAVPVPTAPSDTIQLPMPEIDAVETIKKHKVIDSIRWLATLVVEQAKRAHGQLVGKK